MSSGWTDIWQPMIEAVGTDFGDGVDRPGPDAVELGSIRKLVEPLELDCPLHHDRALAVDLGYRDVPAPMSSVISFTIPPVWQPGDEPVFTRADRDGQPERTSTGPMHTGLEPPVSGFFATDAAVDYLLPVVVGDRVRRRGNKLVACVPKETSVGRGAFSTWQSEIVNQRDEVVARLRNTRYSYDPVPRPAPVPPARPEPATEDPRQDDEWAAQATPDWTQQRCWEDLVVGERVPTIRFPLSVYRLVMAAGSNRDFNSIHHNTEWARATGAPEMYANVLFLQGMWERCVREFIGLRGTITKLSGFRMRSFNTAGDNVSVQGTVDRIWEQDGTGFAELRMWSTNRHGVSVGPGTVVVTLPRTRN